MEKRLLASSRLQNTTIFFVIALATLGAVGVMTAMMTTAATAYADPHGCFTNGAGREICPGDPRCVFTPVRTVCPGPP